jgi:TonB family protein
MTRGVYPYVLVSLGLHLLVILGLLILKGPQLPEVRQRKVVLEFSRREARAIVSRQTPATEISEPDPQPLSGSLDLSGPRTLPTPSARLPAMPERGSAPGRSQVLPASRVELPAKKAPAAALPEPEIRIPTPDLEEILAEVPAAVPSAEAAENAEQARQHGTLASGALEWRGRERKVLKSVRPEFPAVLLQEGQEVDVEAAFAVAPSGQVTEVEITRSSGYAVVDSSVERALLNYLFEPSDGDEADTGKIRFSYRLERGN